MFWLAFVLGGACGIVVASLYWVINPWPLMKWRGDIADDLDKGGLP